MDARIGSGPGSWLLLGAGCGWRGIQGSGECLTRILVRVRGGLGEGTRGRARLGIVCTPSRTPDPVHTQSHTGACTVARLPQSHMHPKQRVWCACRLRPWCGGHGEGVKLVCEIRGEVVGCIHRGRAQKGGWAERGGVQGLRAWLSGPSAGVYMPPGALRPMVRIRGAPGKATEPKAWRRSDVGLGTWPFIPPNSALTPSSSASIEVDMFDCSGPAMMVSTDHSRCVQLVDQDAAAVASNQKEQQLLFSSGW